MKKKVGGSENWERGENVGTGRDDMGKIRSEEGQGFGKVWENSAAWSY